jgi:hypothetical protein
MSIAPDPAEIAAPSDPALYGRRRPLMGPGVWTLVALCALCTLLGAMVARFGPDWFPVTPAAGPAEIQAVAPAAPPAVRLPFGSPLPVETPAAVPEAPSAELGRLDARVATLEADQKGVLDAAAAAIAASALADVAQTSAPFGDELAALERALPMSPDLRALTRLAQTGAPTRAGLAADFEALAGKAATAARDPGEDADLLARVQYALSSIVSIRRVGTTRGSSPDAKLALAQRLLDEGDVEGAVRALDVLPDSARAVLNPWVIAAERRIEVDRHVAALRAEALAGLARASRAPA